MAEGQASSKEVDAYIASQPAEVQAILQKVRAAILAAAPEATELMNYGVPTYKMDKNLVSFGAAKKHLGFYPTPAGMVGFEKELAAYPRSKGAVQLPYDGKIPYVLIGKMTRARVKAETDKAKAKGTKK